MDSVRSWLDPDDVRRLAQRLLTGRPDSVPAETDAPFGSNFEGFATGVPLADRAEESEQRVAKVEPPPVPVSSPPRADVAEADAPPVEKVVVAKPARVAAASAPASPPPQQVVAATTEVGSAGDLSGEAVEPRPPEAPRGPFLHRVQRLREWLRDQFAVRGMFLLDRDGVVIFDDGVHEKLHALARNLAHASRAAPGAGSNVHVKIGATATLEVIPVDTHYGLIVLGAVVPQAVPPRGVALIIDGLRRTATPPE